ncbi:MAG: hypothetical protein COB53_06285 [Elusimicrobia bacterium]|nr:MAG: hypothetical protein COB53_06285 [Elusimicrobiota bacterium]
MGTALSLLAECIQAAAADSFAPRKSLFEALLAQKTYLLDAETKDSCDGSELNLWAEEDSDLGGIWVPLFSTAESAMGYAQSLQTEDALRCVSQAPGRVFELLTAIPRIAGVRLDPPGEEVAGLEWSELRALSEGRLPDEGPHLYDLPDGPFPMPSGLRGRFGQLEASRVGFKGRQVVFPDEAPLALEDFRRWVRLTLDDHEEAWTPCRHFAALMRRKASFDHDPQLETELIAALIEFEMYGDAEAVCGRLVLEPGRAGFSLGQLARIYRRSGRLDECLRICEEGLLDYPDEAALYRNLTLGRAELEDLEGAREAARGGLERFPLDATLRRFV